MRVCILLLVLFALTIGTGLAVNVDIGDVEGFKKHWSRMDSLYSKAR